MTNNLRYENNIPWHYWCTGLVNWATCWDTARCAIVVHGGRRWARMYTQWRPVHPDKHFLLYKNRAFPFSLFFLCHFSSQKYVLFFIQHGSNTSYYPSFFFMEIQKNNCVRGRKGDCFLTLFVYHIVFTFTVVFSRIAGLSEIRPCWAVTPSSHVPSLTS